MKTLFFIVMLAVAALASCGKDFDYTVLREEFYDEDCNKCGLTAAISIPSKMSKDSLLLLGSELRERWSGVLLMDVRIHVPSDYPDDPKGEGWWCTYHYQRYGAHKEKVDEYINYMKSPSKEGEGSLKSESD